MDPWILPSNWDTCPVPEITPPLPHQPAGPPLLPRLPEGIADATFQPVMGTDLRIQVWAGDDQTAEQAQGVALGEVQRLSAVFTTWDESSALSRWRRGELEDGDVDFPPELRIVLADAARWFRHGGGTYHPACEVLRERWLRAEREDVVPDPAEMAELASSIRELPWRVDDGRIVRVGDCAGADLNALVKGWIVDRGLEQAATVPGVRRVALNAGGDLRHHGEGDWGVGIEDPLRPSDNGTNRLATIRVRNRAVATSGLARRGFRVAGQWFGHVVDPRTGWPVTHLAQATVLAPEAATADVLATICGVPAPDEALDWLATSGNEYDALLVTSEGVVLRSPGFPA